MGKILKDIRFYESDFENIKGNSIPDNIGQIFPFKKEINYVGQRIARKLHELKFESGNFDHIYLNLSSLDSLKKLTISSRKVTDWIQYIDYPLNHQEVAKGKLNVQENQIAEITFKALNKLYEKEPQKIQLIKTVKEELDKSGSEIEITSFEKNTKSYIVKISYQINPKNCRHSKAFLEYENLKTGHTFKEHFLNLELFEDIYPLVGSVSIKENTILIKPRRSFKADIYTESYKTPIEIKIK